MSEIDDLKAQIAALLDTVGEAAKELGPIDEEREALTAEEAKAYGFYQQTVAKTRNRKMELDNIAFQARSKLNNANREKERLERAILEAEEKAKQAALQAAKEAEWAVMSEKWDRLTAAAQWREWAKDHQIAAGHMITENRNVILADPMGLGKTLSAIITADMSEAATRLTSPDFPFLGEEKQVWQAEYYENLNTGERKTPWELSEEAKSSSDWMHFPAGHVKKIVNAVERPVGRRILYLCPSSLIRNVEKEFRLWAKHRSVTFVGGMSKASRQFAFEHVISQKQEFVVICNYEAWRKDLSLLQEFIDLDFDTIILDEAHNLKNMKTSAYRGVKSIIDNSNFSYVIPMTGTPILNRPHELFALLTLVNPEQFYSEKDYLLNFCEQDKDTKFWSFQPGGLDRIAKRIHKNFLRRTRDQAGIKLPPKTIIEHNLKVDTDTYVLQNKARKQMAQYATIMMDEANPDKSVVARIPLAVFTRLRQIETWPAGIKLRDPVTNEIKFQLEVEESQKLDYCISAEPDEFGDYTGLIAEFIAEERGIVFCQMTEPLFEMRNRIEKMGYRVALLTGATPPAEREVIANDFDRRYTPNRDQAKFDIVLCNYKVGGVGLNLTAATQMIVLDKEWNPGKRDQAYDRFHRIGQEDPVTIHEVNAEGTIDDWMTELMTAKEGLVDGFNNVMIDTEKFMNFLDNGGLA